jgi:hypothetical protein
MKKSLQFLDEIIEDEILRDFIRKKENPSLTGESAAIYHLKKLKELMLLELEELEKG